MNEYHIDNQKLTCVFYGRLDTLGSQAVDAELSAKLDASVQEVVFDLKEVAYISSSFLKICLKTVHNTGSNHFSIVHVSPGVLKVFQIANLNHLIRINE
ncbi:MAG TPA: STAS domain-containing protein [Prolixibacteraceae bacterium]|nr:STAS domain-containing protein [Prolixibacteraceae bacterium]